MQSATPLPTLHSVPILQISFGPLINSGPLNFGLLNCGLTNGLTGLACTVIVKFSSVIKHRCQGKNLAANCAKMLQV